MPRDMAQITEPVGSNPFASSASSPAVEDQFDTTKRWSSTYRPVELTIEIPSLTSTPIIQPAPPPRAARQSYQSSRRSSRPVSQLPRVSDPEKAAAAPVDPEWDEDYEPCRRDYFFENQHEIKAKCLKVLVYLSAPVFLTSVLLSIWTLLGLLFAILLQPINLFRKTKTLREQTIDFLAPALKIHLSFILSSIRDETYSSYSLPLLIIVNLFAPLVSIAVAISAWTAACFWFYAAIIGDPEGLDRESRRSSYRKEEEEDGKASVLAVRNWWRKWLTRALR